jgi:hypothetical protein
MASRRTRLRLQRQVFQPHVQHEGPRRLQNRERESIGKAPTIQDGDVTVYERVELLPSKY